MHYVSTRASAPNVLFEDVLLAGLAPDGGLYVPDAWPSISAAEIDALRGRSYAQIAATILGKFTGDTFSSDHLAQICAEVYTGFDDPAVAPLRQVGDDDYILELYHGPTLAFKDFAMQALGRMFDEVLTKNGRKLTIIAATSGDTGAAAIDALKNCSAVKVVVLHPEGRVSDVQRRMMTSVTQPNVLNVAVDGSFDDCQAIVKSLFADTAFVERVQLGAVNSINWARIASQSVYYFSTIAALGTKEPVSFVVPTGNFGDVFAGYTAKRMGLNVGKLVVATNSNDILHRAMTSGAYAPSNVTPTISPSMDIQIASNFERLLFEVMDRNGDALRGRMAEFASSRAMQLSEGERARIREEFVSFATSEAATADEMKTHFAQYGYQIDPHTAVARCATKDLRASGVLSGKVVTLSTAHPAKFPDAVEAATGKWPDLPPAHADLNSREERITKAPNAVDAVRDIIDAHAAN